MFEVISPEDLERRLGETRVFLIDLRPEEAYRNFHIAGALNLPYDKLSTDGALRSLLTYARASMPSNDALREKATEFPENAILLLYCERGPTSFAAARKLEAQGYRTAALAGGIRAWRKYRRI